MTKLFLFQHNFFDILNTANAIPLKKNKESFLLINYTLTG